MFNDLPYLFKFQEMDTCSSGKFLKQVDFSWIQVEIIINNHIISYHNNKGRYFLLFEERKEMNKNNLIYWIFPQCSVGFSLSNVECFKIISNRTILQLFKFQHKCLRLLKVVF